MYLIYVIIICMYLIYVIIYVFNLCHNICIKFIGNAIKGGIEVFL